ncbi:MAG: cation:proton antiporter, partial [Myxococcota bacterium]
FSIFLGIFYLILKFTLDVINRLPDETIILLAFASLILSSYISYKLINSGALGAFMSGSIIKAIGYRIDLKKAFSIIKDIFSPFFFFYFGMNIVSESFPMSLTFVMVAILLSIFTKYVVSHIIYRGEKNNIFKNLLFGLLTIRGEFSIVLAAVSAEYLDSTSASNIRMISTLVIFLNMILGLFIIKSNQRHLIHG